MKISRKNKINYFFYLVAILMTGALVFSQSDLCRADGANQAKERYFKVSIYEKMLTEDISVPDGFSFIRYESSSSEKIEISKAITFDYTAKYTKVDFPKMEEKIISSKRYTGIIPAGKNSISVDLKTLMSELGVKDYSGRIKVEITDSKGASALESGRVIELTLIKTALDASAEAAEAEKD